MYDCLYCVLLYCRVELAIKMRTCFVHYASFARADTIIQACFALLYFACSAQACFALLYFVCSAQACFALCILRLVRCETRQVERSLGEVLHVASRVCGNGIESHDQVCLVLGFPIVDNFSDSPSNRQHLVNLEMVTSNAYDFCHEAHRTPHQVPNKAHTTRSGEY